jgi:hypothetical protein
MTWSPKRYGGEGYVPAAKILRERWGQSFNHHAAASLRAKKQQEALGEHNFGVGGVSPATPLAHVHSPVTPQTAAAVALSVLKHHSSTDAGTASGACAGVASAHAPDEPKPKRPRLNPANVQHVGVQTRPVASAADNDNDSVFVNLAVPSEQHLPRLSESPLNQPRRSPVPPAAAMLSPHTHDVEVRARPLGQTFGKLCTAHAN